MAKFSASINHSEKSINAFTATQFKVFEGKKRRMMMLPAALLLVVGALNLVGETFSLILLLLGCLLLVDVGHVPKRTARKMLQNMKGFSTVNYEFENYGVKLREGGRQGEIKYRDVIRLVADRDYYYIFTGPQQVYMLAKVSLKPDKPDEFKAFLKEKTGLKWQTPGTMWGGSIQNILSNVKRGKK